MLIYNKSKLFHWQQALKQWLQQLLPSSVTSDPKCSWGRQGATPGKGQPPNSVLWGVNQRNDEWLVTWAHSVCLLTYPVSGFDPPFTLSFQNVAQHSIFVSVRGALGLQQLFYSQAFQLSVIEGFSRSPRRITIHCWLNLL